MEIEALIHNFPSNDEVYNSYDPTLSIRNDYLNRQYYINGSGSDMIPYYKVHTGQVFFIRNLQFEVLYTHEDIHPFAMEFFNNTSTAIRLTALNTDGTGKPVADSTAVDNVVLGDLQVRGSMVMRARYGDYLKSDMVAVAHHGYNGAEAELYQLIDAQVIWWTESVASMESRVNSTYSSAGTYHHTINEKLLRTTNWIYIIALNPRTTPTDFDITYYYNLTVTLTESGFPGLYSRLESDTEESLSTKQEEAQKVFLDSLFAMNVIMYGETSFSYFASGNGDHGVTFGSDEDYVMGRQDWPYELPITKDESPKDESPKDAVDDPFVDDEILEITW